MTVQEKFAQLGAWCLEYHRDNECSDIDGGDLQDKAIEIGLLGYTPMEKPCGEDGACWCMSYYHPTDWPVDCLRRTEGVREFINQGGTT